MSDGGRIEWREKLEKLHTEVYQLHTGIFP